MNTPAVASGPPAIPAKVAAALEFLRFAEFLRNPPSQFDGGRSESRDLNQREQAVYDAALEVMRLYFTGEQEFGPAAASPEGFGDGPDRRVPVNA